MSRIRLVFRRGDDCRDVLEKIDAAFIASAAMPLLVLA
jgi:hypothetical protein